MPQRKLPYFPGKMARVGPGGVGKSKGYRMFGASADVPEEVLANLDRAIDSRTTGKEFYFSGVMYIPFTGVFPVNHTGLRDGAGSIKQDFKMTFQDKNDDKPRSYPLHVSGSDVAGQQIDDFDTMANNMLMKGCCVFDVVIDPTRKGIIENDLPYWFDLISKTKDSQYNKKPTIVATVTKAELANSGISLREVNSGVYNSITEFLRFALEPHNANNKTFNIYALTVGDNVTGEMYLVCLNGKVLKKPVRTNVLGASLTGLLYYFSDTKETNLTPQSKKVLDDLLSRETLPEDKLKSLKIIQ